MCQHGRGRLPALISLFLAFAQSAALARAAETEQREFTILVDGKDAGRSSMNISVENDGTTVVTANAQVKTTHLLIQTSFKVDSTEWWKADKLTALKSSAVDNGRKTEISATSDGTRLSIKLNQRDLVGSPDAWPSSFWKLPDPRFHNKSIPVLETDTGKEYLCQLQYIGTEQLTFINQPQSCYHFKITGGPYPVDAWFDRYHRLVRQEFVDSGHKVIVQLISLKR
jgi:Family of unknown function (DUF6134)